MGNSLFSGAFQYRQNPASCFLLIFIKLKHNVYIFLLHVIDVIHSHASCDEDQPNNYIKFFVIMPRTVIGVWEWGDENKQITKWELRDRQGLSAIWECTVLHLKHQNPLLRMRLQLNTRTRCDTNDSWRSIFPMSLVHFCLGVNNRRLHRRGNQAVLKLEGRKILFRPTLLLTFSHQLTGHDQAELTLLQVLPRAICLINKKAESAAHAGSCCIHHTGIHRRP